MKIFLSNKEYRLLIDMLYLADWVMHSHTADPNEKHKNHEVLRKKLLSYSKEMDADDIVEHSKKYDDYFETSEYEKSMHEQFLDPYDAETFWENLIDRLSVRDLIRKVGIQKFESMEWMDRSNQLNHFVQKYSEIFENSGLDHVSVDPQELSKIN